MVSVKIKVIHLCFVRIFWQFWVFHHQFCVKIGHFERTDVYFGVLDKCADIYGGNGEVFLLEFL